MKRICHSLLFLLLAPCLLFAQNPEPVPEPTPVPKIDTNIIAPLGVPGNGSRHDPYQFDSQSRCILKLIGNPETVMWDTSDAPDDSEVLDDKYLSFSLANPGEYQVIIYGPNVRAWFIIKGSGPSPPDPPTPVDPVDPVVPVAEKLWMVVIDDLPERTAQQAVILGDPTYWNGFKKLGHNWAIVPLKDEKGTVTPAAEKYDKQTKEFGTPCLVILDASTKKILSEGKLPASKAEIDALVKKYTGGK